MIVSFSGYPHLYFSLQREVKWTFKFYNKYTCSEKISEYDSSFRGPISLSSATLKVIVSRLTVSVKRTKIKQNIRIFYSEKKIVFNEWKSPQ